MANEKDDLLIAGGVIAGLWFLVAKPIMNSFGVSDEDKATLNEIQATAPQNNPFSPQFQPLVNDYGSGMQQYFTALKEQYDNGSAGTGPVNFSDPEKGFSLEVAKAGEIVAHAWDFFGTGGGLFKGQRDAVEQVFAAVVSKYDVAAIAAYLWYNYDTDLYTSLKNGGALFLYGLPPEILASIVTRINSLPDKPNG